MDHVHRIGQDKPVFDCRLYSENTVETAVRNMWRESGHWPTRSSKALAAVP